MVTFQTACKFPGIAGRVKLWVIHLTHARWQIASNLLSRATVTVGSAVARHVVHIAGGVLIVPSDWGYRLTPRDSNGVQEKHFGKRNVRATPRYTTSRENWRKLVRFWMNEVTIVGRLPRLRQRKFVCARLEQCRGKSHKFGYSYPCPRTAKKAKFRKLGVTIICQLVNPDQHKWASRCLWS